MRSEPVQDLVSIIIPCYNQAQFLGEAIESAVGQTHAHVEVLVIDDGSSDATPQVAARYIDVRYMRRRHQGLAATRNAGIRSSRGRYIVFLDSDDRLLPHAVETGLRALAAHAGCACVAGHYRLIAADGSTLAEWKRQPVDDDAYTALLRRNHIAMLATVVFPRGTLDEVGGFNPSLPACEDYDLLLRIARRQPIHCYDEVVAEYRQHQANMSHDPALMLRTALAVHHAQWRIARHNTRHREAYAAGKTLWEEYYGDQVVDRLRARLGQQCQMWTFIRDLATLRRYYPRGYAAAYPDVMRGFSDSRMLRKRIERGVRWVGRRVLPAGLRAFIRGRRRESGRPAKFRVRFGSLRRIIPISDTFGFDRGKPIDRFYIEQFLGRYSDNVRGRVLEFGDDAYSRAFGGGRINHIDVLHVHAGNPKATMIADLTHADHLPSDVFDCIICTQTLHLIYDVQAALDTLHRILKPGGVLLATVPGISQVSRDEWGDQWYWSFTVLSARRLLEERFPPETVTVEARGNVLAATAFLYGLAAEELRLDELAYCDHRYQTVILIRAQKPMSA